MEYYGIHQHGEAILLRPNFFRPPKLQMAYLAEIFSTERCCFEVSRVSPRKLSRLQDKLKPGRWSLHDLDSGLGNLKGDVQLLLPISSIFLFFQSLFLSLKP